MQFNVRYEYSHHKTRERAIEALEDMYATGDVSECEFPEIEHHGKRQPGRQYVITLLHSYWSER